MTTNPEKLFVFLAPGFTPKPIVVATPSENDAMTRAVATRGSGKIDAYVREDVAEAATEAAVKKAIEEERARAWETAHVDE